jgi:signal transduction histidine kinase
MQRSTLLLQFSIISLVLMVGIGTMLGFNLTHYFEQIAVAQQRDAVRDLVPPLIGDHISDEVLRNGAVKEDYTRIELALATLGGSGLVRVKIWNNDGLIIYSDERDLVGQKYDVSPELAETLEGLTVAEISELEKDENIEERGFGELLEVYTPLRQGGKSQIVGAFEGYYDITDLRDKMNATNEFLWISIVFGFSFLYVSLFTLVRSASQRITRQARENTVLLEDTERKAARLAVVNELARSINQSALDLEEVFQTALRGIDRIVPNNGASISLIDEQNGEVLDTVYLSGTTEQGTDKKRNRVDLDIECALRLLAGADTFISGDMAGIEEPSIQSIAAGGTRSLLLVSISLGSRRLGLIMLTGEEKQAFGREDAQILKSVADQLAVAIENTWLIAETAETTALREANKLKDDFMSMVSHELRTPLASIKGYSLTLLAKDGHWDDETRAEFLSIISDESDKLAELVENLLEMTRINGDRLKIMPEPVLLGRYCREVVERVCKHYPEIEFRCEVSDKLPLVEVDPRRLEQVLVNLLQNAAKYSKAEVIKVNADYDGDWGVVVCVEDNGVGIPAEHLPHLFDKFYRVEAKGETGMGMSAGTGLGLAISKALVEAHGGRIWVTSKPGKGTTFYFTVPTLRMHEDGEHDSKGVAQAERAATASK